jgi:WD40 repeat protein
MVSSYTLNSTWISTPVNTTGHSLSVLRVVQINQNQTATASDDATIKVWDATTYELINTYNGHWSNVRGLVVLPGGSLASGGFDGVIRVWNMQTQTSSTINVPGWVFTMKTNPVNGYLVVNIANSISIFNASSLASIGSISTGVTYYDLEILLPSGNIILGGASTMDIFTLPLGNKTFTYSLVAPNYVGRIKQLPDNLTVVCSFNNGTLVLFDSNTYAFGLSYIAHAGDVKMISLTPDLVYVMTGSRLDSSLLLWTWSTMSLTLVNNFTLAGSMYSGIILASIYSGISSSIRIIILVCLDPGYKDDELLLPETFFLSVN